MDAPACVIDAGVAVGWFLPEADGGPRGSDHAVELLRMAVDGQVRMVAPELILPEVANVLWKLTTLSGYPVAAATRAVEALGGVPLTLEPMGPNIGRAHSIATQFGCTVYDAVYVALAESLRVPLLTADHRLVHRLRPAFPWIEALG